jgi:hypothetical protein
MAELREHSAKLRNVNKEWGMSDPGKMERRQTPIAGARSERGESGVRPRSERGQTPVGPRSERGQTP